MKTDSWTDWEYFTTILALASGSDIWAQTGTNSKIIKTQDKEEEK